MMLVRVISRLRAALAWRLSWLWWRVVRPLPRRRTVRATRLGFDLELNLRDSVQDLVYREDSYEPKLSARIIRELRLGDVFVDIGAHIGLHALVAARELGRLGGGHVYAFEPTTDSADRLAEAAERNGISNLTLVRAAVGEAAGHIELRSVGAFGADEPSARSAFGPGRVVGRFPVVRFDQWAQEAGISRLNLVKIDIEGGEISALVGMRQTLARLRPRLLFVEVNGNTLGRAGVSTNELHTELALSGYMPTDRICDEDGYENVVFGRRD